MKPGKIKVSGIILAAGTASRMGRTKQLLAFQRTTLLGQVILNAKQSLIDEIIVVLGHHADDIRNKTNLKDTITIFNPDFKKGQSTSLIAGIKSVASDSDAAMFLLADQPFVASNTINALICAFKSSTASIGIPYYKNKQGNPVIVSKSMFSRIHTLTRDIGARALFQAYKDQILKIPVSDPSILADVDTIADYNSILRMIPSG